VQPACIPGHPAISIAKLLKFLPERIERQLILLHAPSERQDIFHQRHAIKSTEVHHQPFLTGLFQRVRLIGRPKEPFSDQRNDFANGFFDEFVARGK
jgi:hypothetical protein